MRFSILLATAVVLPGWPVMTACATDVPIRIPLKHVDSAGQGDDPDMLGIMVGLNDGPARLLQFDTGSDALNIQAEAGIRGVTPAVGAAPEKYGYGDGSYGYWQQKIRFDSISYYDPEKPSRPIATFGGGHVGNQVLEMVYTKDYHAFRDKELTRQPVGHDDDGNALYADLAYRRKLQNGEPGEDGAFYGTFGASDSIGNEIETSPLGGRTRSGYVIAANANLDAAKTPGCAPCLIVHLTPAIRSQFTAVVPWGNVDGGGGANRSRFPQSGANASAMYEGSYAYSISFKAGKAKRKVEFRGAILLDTGTADFLYPSATNVLAKLRSKGFELKENEDGEVDFAISGSNHAYDQLNYEAVDISRLDDEDEGDGITVGLPFFQANTVVYDLENRSTGYSQFFVTVDDFTTDGGGDGVTRLNHVTDEMGSQGWLGLAGVIRGSREFRVGRGAVVRMTGASVYTGATIVEADANLYLAGPADIGQSARVVVDGVLNIEQKGSHVRIWGVAGDADEVAIRSLGGSGSVYIGNRRLTLTAADARFQGGISDIDDSGNSMGGRLSVIGGKQELAGENSYTGTTIVGSGAELHVTGSLAGDVLVRGLLHVDGDVAGQVTVESGGALTGSGKVGRLIVSAGGRSELAPSSDRR